jgi:DNA-binding CsgD family transcriptional regulator
MGDREFLSAAAIRTFGLIARGERVPAECADYVAELVEWGVVTLDTGDENRPVALNPHEAAQRRMTDRLKEAAKRVAELSQLPEITGRLGELYEQGQARTTGGSEYLDDPAVVNARLDDVIAGAQTELLTAQPGGPRNEEQLNRSLERDTAALDRGVVKLTLYRATVRDNPVTAEYARAMSNRPSGKCAEFGTLVGPFERAIIVDRRVAFISNHLVEGAPPHAAWQVTDPAMVAYIAAEFDDRWRRADPWHGEMRARGQHGVDTVSSVDGIRTTRRQREIMRDMVAGRDQRAIAGRLGVSVRTVSDEINALRDLFDASSREQLVYKWAFSADRIVDDSTDALGGGPGAGPVNAVA